MQIFCRIVRYWLVPLAIVFIVTLLLCTGCGPSTTKIIEPTETSQLKNGVALQTASHDGHDFILVNTYHGLAALHHPSCPCLK